MSNALRASRRTPLRLAMTKHHKANRLMQQRLIAAKDRVDAIKEATQIEPATHPGVPNHPPRIYGTEHDQPVSGPHSASNFIDPRDDTTSKLKVY